MEARQVRNVGGNEYKQEEDEVVGMGNRIRRYTLAFGSYRSGNPSEPALSPELVYMNSA